MADRSREKLTREDFNARRAVPRRHGAFRRALTLVLVLAVVLAAVVVAAYGDLSNVDSLRRLLTYNKTSQETAESAAYSYDSDRGNLFALLEDETLVVAGKTQLRVIGKGDSSIYSGSVALENPALAVGKHLAAVYEVGGTKLYILGAKGLVREMSEAADNAIISVSFNASDYMTVVTEKSGYKSALSVYNASGDPVFTYNSSQYIVGAKCERDCKHVVFTTVGEREGSFASTIHRYALDGEAQLSACTLSDALVLQVDSVGGTNAALADDRLALLKEDGSLAGTYYFSEPYLRGYALHGDDFVALNLSRYRSGSMGRIVTVGLDGAELASLETRQDVVDIDACGKYLAVLYSDKLVVYTSDLAEYAGLDDTRHAKNVLMRRDGTALLLGAAQARLFIP